VEFKFINPLWAWVMAARRQDPLDLHWKPVPQGRRVPLYGGGIQHGEFFRTACRGLPKGASIMAIALHWDGTSAHKLSSSPICIGVGNTNTSHSSSQFCIGYMPHVPDEGNRAWRETAAATTVKHYIRQECARTILSVIEEAATRGVKCTLKNQHYIEIQRLLFPRLCSLNFDQPEAQSFFGMQNKRGCSKCRRRKGYSAFRRSSGHDTVDIQNLYQWANDPRCPHRKLAREKLERWGFNYRRQCCLLTLPSTKLLVHIPGRHEVFPCVDFRDRMHGLVIFLHRVLFQTLDQVIKGSVLRRALDARLAFVGKRGFRVDGTVIRKPKSVFTDVDMSACEKATVIFLLSHVLGPSGQDILPEMAMMPLLTAVAHAQLILIAVHGRRMYSEEELRIIMDRGFRMIFGCLESLRQWEYNKSVEEAQNDSAPPPKRFKREDRTYRKHDTPVSDTDSTDEEDSIGGLGVFSHGKLCLTHQHWVDQAIVAGGFNVHCTQGAEASHKINMHLVSARARHLDANYTQSRMLTYLRWYQVFEGLHDKPRPMSRQKKTGVSMLLRILSLNRAVALPFVTVAFQSSFLHEKVRVSGGEFLNLLCDRFGLAQARRSYLQLQSLHFVIALKYTREDLKTFWATDSRRDILRLKGHEGGNSFCCETICFVQIDNVLSLQIDDLPSDRVDLVLVRWFSPHASSWERDGECRPLCPGPLSINNCLWAYSRTPKARRAFANRAGQRSRSFNAYSHTWNCNNDQERDELWNREKHAYYGFISPDSIIEKVNMSPTFQNGSALPDYSRWLETVTMTT